MPFPAVSSAATPLPSRAAALHRALHPPHCGPGPVGGAPRAHHPRLRGGRTPDAHAGGRLGPLRHLVRLGDHPGCLLGVPGRRHAGHRGGPLRGGPLPDAHRGLLRPQAVQAQHPHLQRLLPTALRPQGRAGLRDLHGALLFRLDRRPAGGHGHHPADGGRGAHAGRHRRLHRRGAALHLHGRYVGRVGDRFRSDHHDRRRTVGPAVHPGGAHRHRTRGGGSAARILPLHPRAHSHRLVALHRRLDHHRPGFHPPAGHLPAGDVRPLGNGGGAFLLDRRLPLFEHRPAAPAHRADGPPPLSRTGDGRRTGLPARAGAAAPACRSSSSGPCSRPSSAPPAVPCWRQPRCSARISSAHA
jgi:hypothetical protein